MFDWASFLTYALITAVTPGPNNIMSMSIGNRKGFRRALPFNIGIWIGFSVVMLVCAALCNVLQTLIPQIELPMKIAGAAYLLYLAWSTLRHGGGMEAEAGRDHDRLVSGLLLQFINPKIYLYGIMSMEVYILPHFAGQMAPLIGFALLLAFIGFVFTLCWSAFGSLFKRLFTRHAKWVGTVMALLLVWCAVSLFV